MLSLRDIVFRIPPIWSPEWIRRELIPAISDADEIPDADVDERGLVLKANNITNLDQTISATYVQSEVQTISDKLDELLDAQRVSGAM